MQETYIFILSFLCINYHNQQNFETNLLFYMICLILINENHEAIYQVTNLLMLAY